MQTCERCGEILDGEVTFDVEVTNELQTVDAHVRVMYTLCNLCNHVNEIIEYKELVNA